MIYIVKKAMCNVDPIDLTSTNLYATDDPVAAFRFGLDYAQKVVEGLLLDGKAFIEIEDWDPSKGLRRLWRYDPSPLKRKFEVIAYGNGYRTEDRDHMAIVLTSENNQVKAVEKYGKP